MISSLKAVKPQDAKSIMFRIESPCKHTSQSHYRVVKWNLIFFNFACLRHVINKNMKQMSYYIPTKIISPIRALVHVHEAKISNSHYLIKEFKEFTGNQNTPRLFGVLRDRPQVLYIFGKLVNRAIR